MRKPVFSDGGIATIAALILMIALVIAAFAGCFPNPARAAEVAPSTSPAPDLVGNAVAFNVIACTATVVIFALGALLVLKSMKRNSNSNSN